MTDAQQSVEPMTQKPLTRAERRCLNYLASGNLKSKYHIDLDAMERMERFGYVECLGDYILTDKGREAQRIGQGEK